MREVSAGSEFGDAPGGELAFEGAAKLFAIALANGFETTVVESGAAGIDQFDAAFPAKEAAGDEFPSALGGRIDARDGEGGGTFSIPGVEFDQATAFVELDLAATESHGFEAGFEQERFRVEQGAEVVNGKHQ